MATRYSRKMWNLLCQCRRLFLAWMILIGLTNCKPDSKRADQPLAQEVYIWQRVWTPSIPAAITQTSGHFSHYVVLTGEIDPAPTPVFYPARPDYVALRESKVGIGLALRIGPWPGPFVADDRMGRFIREKVSTLLAEAAQAGVKVAELQIDFDCAQAKLSGYLIWLKMMQQAAGPVPVIITALPSWLDEPDFSPLVRAAGGYVLQVHSVQIPNAQAPQIFNSARALNWVRKADRIGVPFRVALPTYTQMVRLPDGQIFPARSDAVEIQRTLALWKEDRPDALTGVIWYRLPLTSDDPLNWRWVTLQAVIEGKKLQAIGAVQVSAGNPADLTLKNTGNLDLPFPTINVAGWEKGHLQSQDALAGWTMDIVPGSIRFSPDARLREERLPPGGKKAIGWLRIDSAEKIHASILEN